MVCETRNKITALYRHRFRILRCYVLVSGKNSYFYDFNFQTGG